MESTPGLLELGEAALRLADVSRAEAATVRAINAKLLAMLEGLTAAVDRFRADLLAIHVHHETERRQWAAERNLLQARLAEVEAAMPKDGDVICWPEGGVTLDALEDEAIRRALAANRGVQKGAARQLGISERRLSYILGGRIDGLRRRRHEKTGDDWDGDAAGVGRDDDLGERPGPTSDGESAPD